jgi:predicted nuclease of predicted toxin-antitoxin system
MSLKLLIDANLSWRIVSLLKAEFLEIEHVSNIGLGDSPSDTSIWVNSILRCWFI